MYFLRFSSSLMLLKIELHSHCCSLHFSLLSNVPSSLSCKNSESTEKLPYSRYALVVPSRDSLRRSCRTWYLSKKSFRNFAASARRSFLFLCYVNATSAFDFSNVCMFIDIFSVATFSCLICSGVTADILFLALGFAEDGLRKFSLFDVSRFSEATDD